MAGRSKGAKKLYTLTEVAQKTGISMPTLQRYKKLYQDRIPSEGEGRKQRYPHASLKVFNQIKKENIGRRGRPRKADSVAKSPTRGRKPKASSRKASASTKAKAGRKARATKQASSEKASLLTLTEISRRTGISYPTLTRYVKKFGDQLKSEGTGRLRRFYAEAVPVFKQLRSESRGGGRKKKGAAKRTVGRKAASKRTTSSAPTGEVDVALTRRVAALEKQLNALQKKLSRPVRFTVLPQKK